MKCNYGYHMDKNKIIKLATEASSEQLHDVVIRTKNRFKVALMNLGYSPKEINVIESEYIRVSKANSELIDDEAADFQTYLYLKSHGVKTEMTSEELK